MSELTNVMALNVQMESVKKESMKLLNILKFVERVDITKMSEEKQNHIMGKMAIFIKKVQALTATLRAMNHRARKLKMEKEEHFLSHFQQKMKENIHFKEFKADGKNKMTDKPQLLGKELELWTDDDSLENFEFIVDCKIKENNKELLQIKRRIQDSLVTKRLLQEIAEHVHGLILRENCN